MTFQKAVLKKFNRFFDMNDKRKNLILLQILDEIQQDNTNGKDSINL